MKDHVWIIWVVAIAAMTVIIALVRFITWYTQKKRGIYVHNKVDGVLKRYGIIRNFKILRDFDLSANGQTVHVQHALIGFFGIIFLSARGETADFYGEKKSEDWLMVKNDKRSRIPNPIKQNDDAMSVARAILSKNKIYNVPMEGLAVFSGRPKKTTIYCSDNSIIRYSQLSKYLNKAKFDKDNNIDVDAIKEIFLNSEK